MVKGSQDSVATAQQAFQLLLRDYVGPALREDGFKGPGGRYRKQVDDRQVLIGFGKSKWSDRNHVDYAIGVRVFHEPTVETFNRANLEAERLGREMEDAPSGNWSAGIPGPISNYSVDNFFFPEVFFNIRCANPADHWITLRPSDAVAEHAAAIVRDMRECTFPEVDAQLLVPLTSPTPPSQRPVRSEQSERQRLARWHEGNEELVRRLQEAGISTEPTVDFSHIQIFRSRGDRP